MCTNDRMSLVLYYEGVSTPLTRVDDVSGLPSFVCSRGSIHHDGTNWVVADIGHSVHSTARHPHTVYDHEWSCPEISFHIEGGSTIDDPLCLESDLGVDIFYRLCSMTRPVWYRSPSGRVTHSGAKRIHGEMGRRWCSVCKLDISGNNFVHQHMRNKHADDTNEWELFCTFLLGYPHETTRVCVCEAVS